MLPLLLVALAQTGNTTIADPDVLNKKITATAVAAKRGLDVNCIGGCSSSGSSSSVTTDIRDAGIVQQQLVDVLAQLALIKAKTDNIDVLLSTRTKPVDSQTVTGSLTCNAGTNLNTSLVCLEATQTNGTAKAIARGGAKGATAAADTTSTANGADHQGLDVQLQNATVAVTQSGAWSLSANQSVNVAQVNGSTISTAATGVQLVGIEGRAGTSFETTAGVLDYNFKNIGNAAVSTAASGVQKVGVVGNAGAAFDGPTGSAPPANALFLGLRETTNLVGAIQCDKTANASISTATNTQLVALSGSTLIYVCSYAIEIQGVVTTAGTLELNYGTGTACATGTVHVTPTYVGSTTAGNPFVVMQGPGIGYIFKTTAGQALCATSTTTTPQKVFVTYGQF